MTTNSKTFIPLHGNYHGYYSKRPFTSDSRLDVLPPSLFHGARVLDVGCNEGWLTCDIAQTRGAHRVVGVDIDPVLVSQAWKRRRTVWSLQEPYKELEPSAVENASPPRKRGRTGLHRQGGDEVDSYPTPRPEYFPASFEHSIGPIPLPISRERTNAFPQNVSFRAADWAKEGIPEDSDEWDVILALSISKWVHLNDGDAGLIAFFTRVRSSLRLGGTFILEPQEWSSYAKARRMHPKLKENAKGLEIRPDDFPEILQKLGFTAPTRLSAGGGGGFDRPIHMYKKTA